MAKDSHVVVLPLPAHTSDKLQPVDLSFNLSQNFIEQHARFRRQNISTGSLLTLKTFFKVFTTAY